MIFIEYYIEKHLKFCYNFFMKRLYDVQQLLKRFGIIVYMGNRLYDIEMMQIELNRIYQAGVLDRLEYMEAELVLRREHRLELEYQKSRENE
ncbi:hypothetical protein DAT299_14730 [Streptococcus suis]|uniref:DUF910 family protein n=2 Tax=Streptococcus suis TaxID=1307 RepID=D5AJF5_STRGZ|nr:hypothetical protein SSU05_1684 [Streptococcus suis 05ZYH33]ABP92851.1 hypothetical protein SSU98_1693 [Streptococcus suis 98HAH33]ADE31970.1 hypothetical protein SSGZ1_1514 [Streptococcus suis GZ1]ADV70713.1 hypothetical protein SSUJS14_1653 [Streptococcus suis JS14]AEB81944.1 hypothetical protein SSUST3_1527 [Streptococcus suis ST3]AER15807.1 hypothetical protein SSU12_1630 [Streptococcus suis SS12]AER17864.1 hypothetical protein SSUD9_1692 [Streptococcus suis D9]AER44834.1 hypothetical